MFETTTDIKKVGNIVTLYGIGGIGKTTTLAQAVKEAGEKGIFIPIGEDGLSTLQRDVTRFDLTGVNRLPDPIMEWDNEKKGGFVQVMKHLLTDGGGYETISIDSISMILPSLEDYCFDKYFLKDPEAHGKNMTEDKLRNKAYGFGKSQLIAFMSNEWSKFLLSIKMLRDRGKNIFISSHSKISKAKAPDQDLEYDIVTLSMPKTKNEDLATELYNTSDFFLYGKKDIKKVTGDRGDKAIGGKNRVYVTEGDAVVSAKSRGTMPEEIEANYETIKKYL